MKALLVVSISLTFILFINRQSYIKDEVELKDFKFYSEYSKNKMKKIEKIIEGITLIHERKKTMNKFKLFVKERKLNNKEKVLGYLKIDTNHYILNEIPDVKDLSHLTKHSLEIYEKDINYFEQLFDERMKHLLKNYRNQVESFLIYQDLQKTLFNQ